MQLVQRHYFESADEIQRAICDQARLCKSNRGGEIRDYTRSRIGPIQSSGTLIVPSVSVVFTVP